MTFLRAPDVRLGYLPFPQSLMPPDLCRTIAAIRRVFADFDPKVQSTNGLITTQKAVIKLRANQKEPRLMRPFFKTWLTICLLMPLAAHATNREQRLPNVNGFTPKVHSTPGTSKAVKLTVNRPTQLSKAHAHDWWRGRPVALIGRWLAMS